MKTKQQFKDQLINYYSEQYGISLKEINTVKAFNKSFVNTLDMIYWNNRHSKVFKNS